MTKLFWNVLTLLTLVGCLVASACTGGKSSRCSACSSNSECQSGVCAAFSNGGDKRLLCAGSATGSETCTLAQ